jgi:LacI family transcriptional regulator
MSPPMSSVRQPLAEVARRVVAALVDELRGADNTPEGVMLRPELVIREWRGPEPVH